MLGLAILAAAFLYPLGAFGADISGRVTNEAGEPLRKVPVCLVSQDTPSECAKIRWTGHDGLFRFRGIQSLGEQRIRVHNDPSAAARKYQRYATYVWGPLEQQVNLSDPRDEVAVADFVGKFNFSNFQRVLSLSGSDFPELANIDAAANYVALKIFTVSGDKGAKPETIFLGQVKRIDSLRVEASIPLSVSQIRYEIFSLGLSVTGSIALSGV